MTDRITRVLQESGHPDLPASIEWLQGAPCVGSKFHSPQPLLTRPYYPQEVLGHAPEPDELPVYLCSTCWDNLGVYLSVLLAHGGATPQSVRRDFGNTIRALGDPVWADHLKRSLGNPVGAGPSATKG